MPCHQAAPRAVLFVGGDGGGGCCGACLDLCVMLLFQRFDALLQISAGFDQVLVRFLQFILVQVELRLGNIQLVLQRVFLRLLGLCNSRNQFLDPLLIGVEQSLGLADAVFDLERIGAQRRRVRFHIAQCGREGEGERVVGDPQRRLSIGLFVGGFRQPRQPLRRRVGALIDQFRRRRGGGALFRDLGGGWCGFPPGKTGCGKQHHQHEGRYLLHDSHSLPGSAAAGAVNANCLRHPVRLG